MKSIIYARTSTKDQRLDIQLDALNELSKRMNYQLVDTIIDEGVSGGKLGMNREGMKRLLQMVNRKEVDVVLVYSVDRVGRKLSDIISITELLSEKGVGLIIHKNGIDTTTSMGRHMLSFFALVAEMEKDFITSRVRDGMAVAKKKGKKIGRKKLPGKICSQVMALRSEGKGINRIAKILGIGNGSVARIINEFHNMAA